jgi:hypothetical protein
MRASALVSPAQNPISAIHLVNSYRRHFAPSDSRPSTITLQRLLGTDGLLGHQGFWQVESSQVYQCEPAI